MLTWLRNILGSWTARRVAVQSSELVRPALTFDCEWEFWSDPGEKEHGLNQSRRRCRNCGRIQDAHYHAYGDIRVSWHDRPNDKLRDGGPVTPGLK